MQLRQDYPCVISPSAPSHTSWWCSGMTPQQQEMGICNNHFSLACSSRSLPFSHLITHIRFLPVHTRPHTRAHRQSHTHTLKAGHFNPLIVTRQLPPPCSPAVPLPHPPSTILCWTISGASSNVALVFFFLHSCSLCRSCRSAPVFKSSPLIWYSQHIRVSDVTMEAQP